MRCPFLRFDPVWIRNVRQNHRIMRTDACDHTPALTLDLRRRHLQVAAQARSREPVSPSSAQYSIAAGAASFAAARERPGIVRADDPALAQPARPIPGGEAGDDFAMASLWIQSVLALEIAK